MLLRILYFMLVTTLLISAVSGIAHQESDRYDTLLKGGHVIDPANNIDGLRDVAIRGASIARVDQDIPAALADEVIDVSGYYVTPGLIDMHVHVYYNDWSYSVKPEPLMFSSGVTTVVDAGSAGWATFPRFKEAIIDQTQMRVLAFLN